MKIIDKNQKLKKKKKEKKSKTAPVLTTSNIDEMGKGDLIHDFWMDCCS